MNISSIIFCSALLMSFSGSLVMSKDFCEAFRENGDKIDYLYKPGIRHDNEKGRSTHNIIVNGMFWTLVFTKGGNPTVEFDPHQSGSAPLFTNKYFAALWFRTGLSDTARGPTILFPKNNVSTIDVITIRSDDHKTIRPLSNFKPNRTAVLQGLPSENYSFVFGANVIEWWEPLFDFVITSNNGFNEKRYRFSVEGNDFRAAQVMHTNIEKPGVTQKKGVLAITSQYGPHDNIKNGWGYLILFNDNLVIKWCFRRHNDNLDNCFAFGVLDDCSQIAAPTSTTTKPEVIPEKNGFPIIIIVILVIVAVIIAAIILLLLLFSKKKSEEGPDGASKYTLSTVGVTKLESKKSVDIGPKVQSPPKTSPSKTSPGPKPSTSSAKSPPKRPK